MLKTLNVNVEIPTLNTTYSMIFNIEAQDMAIYSNKDRLETSIESFIIGVANTLTNNSEIINFLEMNKVIGYDREKVLRKVRGQIKFYLHGINFQHPNEGTFRSIINEYDCFYETVKELEEQYV